MANVCKVQMSKIEKIHELLCACNNTIDDIAKLTDLTPDQVKRIIRVHFPHLRDLKRYRSSKLEIFEGVQAMAVRALVPKIQHAPLRDLTTLIGTLEDKIWRIGGGADQKVEVSVRIEDLVKKKEAVRVQMIEQGVDRFELDRKVEEHLQVCYDGQSFPVDDLIQTEKMTQEELWVC